VALAAALAAVALLALSVAWLATYWTETLRYRRARRQLADDWDITVAYIRATGRTPPWSSR
jgi:hypothetical protein